MKKTAAFLMAFALIGTGIAPLSQAGVLNLTAIEASAAQTYGDFEYTISNNTVTITGYKGSGGEVQIPDYINNKKVTTIASNAFQHNKKITSFKFGYYVTTVQSWAFYDCANLKTITLCQNLSTGLSGGYLFNGCDKLETINMPYGMKDPGFVFHFKYLACFPSFVRNETDKYVGYVYEDLKSKNPSLNWNLSSLTGKEREKAKYEIAKYIHSKLGGSADNNDVYIKYIRTAEETSPFALVTGKGTCAGQSSAYVLLLLKAGFTLNEIDIIGAPEHQLAGIKLWNQWYLVECTNNDAKSFGMHHTTDGWYKAGTYNAVKVVNSKEDLYMSMVTYRTKNGTSSTLNANTQAYLTSKYGKANGGASPYQNEYARGDINMDGSVDSFDLTMLRKYLNNNYTNNMNLVNCDFNFDGNINSNDLTSLSRFLLGYTNY